MKLIRNRLFLASICVVISAVCVFSFLGINKSEDIKTYKLTQEVSEGTQISEDMIEEVTVGSKGMLDVITEKEEIVGKFANNDLVTGQIVLKNNLANSQSEILNGLEKVTDGQIAYSISIKTLASSASDKILSGDIVTVFVNLNGESLQPINLKYIEILNATTSDGLEKTETTLESIATVTMLVTEQQALLLNEYEYTGEIHLALVHRGEDKVKENYLAEQIKITEEQNIENLPFIEGESDGEVVLLND